MKRKIVNVATFILAVIMAVFAFASCQKEGKIEQATLVESTETLVVIKVDKIQGEPTLFDAMTWLQEQGQLSFTITEGMITGINGKNNPADYSACWMVYTSDEDLSNTSWGTFEYQGAILGSAAAGANELPVSVGEYYVWNYQNF